MESLFDFPQFKITKKIRLIELFGGIGSQAMALRDIGADFEHYKLVEFDKFAVKSYNAIHDTRHTTHDIRDIHAKDLEIKDKDKYCYLMTYSFPCTDLSVAGKMQGMSKEDWQNGNATRSGLLWEVERILKECTKEELPDVLLMENVPQVHAEQNRADFDAWLNFLKSKGYKNFWQDLNAKDYGIPQNRDRCFCVSFLSDDDFIEYEFPKGVRLEKVVKDFLEQHVAEKYYIDNEKGKKLLSQLIDSYDLKDITKEAVDGTVNNPQIRTISNAITTRISASGICNHKQESMAIVEKVICRMTGRNPDNPKSRQSGLPTEQMLEPNAQGICGALTTVQKDNLCPEIKQATKEGSIKCKVGGYYDASFPGSTTRRGRVQNGGDVTPTITAQGGENINYVETVYRIRKLTPKECWRLMGYTDEDFEKAASVNSNTQLYKQAGNAIIKQVLMAIFSKML